MELHPRPRNQSPATVFPATAMELPARLRNQSPATDHLNKLTTSPFNRAMVSPAIRPPLPNTTPQHPNQATALHQLHPIRHQLLLTRPRLLLTRPQLLPTRPRLLPTRPRLLLTRLRPLNKAMRPPQSNRAIRNQLSKPTKFRLLLIALPRPFSRRRHHRQFSLMLQSLQATAAKRLKRSLIDSRASFNRTCKAIPLLTSHLPLPHPLPCYSHLKHTTTTFHFSYLGTRT